MSESFVLIILLLLVVVEFRIYVIVVDYKFMTIVQNPDSIQNMESVPIWLKYIAWDNYGRLIKTMPATMPEEAMVNRLVDIVAMNEIHKLAPSTPFRKQEKMIKDAYVYAKRKVDTCRLVWKKMKG